MMQWSDHLLIAPVIVPLLAGALLVLLGERRRWLKPAIGLASVLALLGTALALLLRADGHAGAWGGAAIGADGIGIGADVIGVYLTANWAAPFGIALAVDRLSALMLLLTALLALAALLFALARWDRAGVHFHPLLQFLLMGINGAFLTTDLFNLFVFFEVMLVASYGLALHGSGVARVRAGLQYIVVNLLASALFLVGVALIYAVTGTLNMADLARLVPLVADADRVLLEAGAAILGIAFLVKGAMWPLNFWLPTTYAAASAPVAAIFAVMTKVGIYVVLRLWLLVFAGDSGASSGFGGAWLLYGGLVTLGFGAIGMLAAQDLGRVAGFAILISSGTVFAAIGFGQPALIAAALFYLVSSTLALAAFLLLIELVERSRGFGTDMLVVTMEMVESDEIPTMQEPQEIGVAIPAAMAFLGLAFTGCALVITGLPPLSGFVAKFALLDALLNPAGLGVATGTIMPVAWWMLVLLIGSGLVGVVTLVRLGIRTFWAPVNRLPPRLRVIEVAPIILLLLLVVALTVQAGPVMGYLERTVDALHRRGDYIERVLSTPPTPAPVPQVPR